MNGQFQSNAARVHDTYRLEFVLSLVMLSVTASTGGGVLLLRSREVQLGGAHIRTDDAHRNVRTYRPLEPGTSVRAPAAARFSAEGVTGAPSLQHESALEHSRSFVKKFGIRAPIFGHPQIFQARRCQFDRKMNTNKQKSCDETRCTT
jgi:hypothetical protein